MTTMLLKTDRTDRQRSVPMTDNTIFRIMQEWREECESIKARFSNNLLRDSQPPQIRELEDLLYVIYQSFPVSDGKNAAELSCQLCLRASHEWSKARRLAKSELLGHKNYTAIRRHDDVDVVESRRQDDGRSDLKSWMSNGHNNSQPFFSPEDAIEARVRELMPPDLLRHIDSGDCDDQKLWDFSRFAAEILRTARVKSISTKEVVRSSLDHISSLYGRELRDEAFRGLFGPAYEKTLTRDCLTATKPRGSRKTKV